MSKKTQVKIIQLEHAKDLPPPQYATTGAAGADLFAATPSKDIVIKPGCQTLVPTGIKVILPVGYEAQIRSRSGLALKDRVSVANSPGTIDSDYRGEVGVILRNDGNLEIVIQHGARIAQMVIAPVVQAEFLQVDGEESTTERGAGGFGSTGV